MPGTPELTALLRTSDESLWVRLRELLWEHGIDPATVELEESHEEDESCEYGVVMTPDGSRFEYEIDYSERLLDEATFSVWRRLP
jgi:hypothetical protein